DRWAIPARSGAKAQAAHACAQTNFAARAQTAGNTDSWRGDRVVEPGERGREIRGFGGLGQALECPDVVEADRLALEPGIQPMIALAQEQAAIVVRDFNVAVEHQPQQRPRPLRKTPFARLGAEVKRRQTGPDREHLELIEARARAGKALVL